MTADRTNIVLTGFMGVGKSTVGHQVARRLGRTFVDMDELIAQRAGMSISEIFARHGEAVFRQYEQALCAELAAQEDLVIATGGGALVDPQNREALARHGYLICLDCGADELARRLDGDQGRPMLWADDPVTRLRELLRARRDAYADIPHHVNTDGRPPEQVAEDVLRLYHASPRTWQVGTPTGDYQVHLAPGGLVSLGALLRARGIEGRVAVVSDEHVWPLYGARVLEGLQAGHYHAEPIMLPAGEQYKTLATVSLLYDRLAEAGVDRSSAVVALGGGVITDMAGFAAATFMRGIPVLPAPTSLLGMIDASIGGKVAVDHPRGKNLIGAFVRPLLVMLDPETLSTLPDIERRAGLAEIIKAGVIADPELFAAFEREEGTGELRWLAERAIQVKIDVVAQDPYEQGRRAVLNLGHTFAHAFEVLADYALHHGLAVSIGMAAAAHLAELCGFCSAATRARIVAALERHELPVTYDAQPPERVYEAMGADKKRQGARLRFVLPREIGDVIVAADVSREQVIEALERIRP